MKFRFAATFVLASFMFGHSAVAQMMSGPQMPMGKMPMPPETSAPPPVVTTSTPPQPNNPSTAALMEANAKMHRAMDIRYSGKPSLDFVSAMIPHHRGAIEMAQIALRFSTDRQTRRLAQKIIGAQQTEIAQMQAIALRLQR